MSLLDKKRDIQNKLAGLQAQLDIVDDMLSRGETDIQGTISDNILQYLRRKPLGANAKNIVMVVSALTGANETSVRTRISKLVSQHMIVTEGKEPFTYKFVRLDRSLSSST